MPDSEPDCDPHLTERAQQGSGDWPLRDTSTHPDDHEAFSSEAATTAGSICSETPIETVDSRSESQTSPRTPAITSQHLGDVTSSGPVPSTHHDPNSDSQVGREHDFMQSTVSSPSEDDIRPARSIASRSTTESWDVDRYMEEIEQYIARVGEYVGGIALNSSVATQTNHYLAYRRAEESRQSQSDCMQQTGFSADIYAGIESSEDDGPLSARFSSLPDYEYSGRERSEWTQKDVEDYYPRINEPKDPARILHPKDITLQRAAFLGLVIALNGGALTAALLSRRHLWVLVFILFIKTKDCLSVILVAINLMYRKIRSLRYPEPKVSPQWILSLIPTYSESEEQIVKTVYSLRDNRVAPHQQVICIIIDGKPRDIRSHLTRTVASLKRPYVTSKFKRGQLHIDAGFMEDVPVIIFEKVRNAGKKDSLILCHDLFNHPRENMPLYSKLLRTEVWHNILPELTYRRRFSRFDMIFCTDADSIIHMGAVAALADGLARDKNCIAACGLVLVEFELGKEWSFWNLYQQFQYSFGQYVRRRAESVWGKVTCLPGCITMIAVRPEMAGAIAKYAEPVTAYPVILHQVQYLGTDRRLTYSMLSQSKKLTTAFVPAAISETVAPLSLRHYLSQRRRWGSNAYFNNIFYCFGSRMSIITRVASCMELVRLTMVYYRLANTIMFLYGIGTDFQFKEILPLLVVSFLPTIWFAITTTIIEKEMRKRTFKLFLGFWINRFIAPMVSVTVFTKVATNLGSQVWGMTGGSAATKQQPVPDQARSPVASTATAAADISPGRRGTISSVQAVPDPQLAQQLPSGEMLIVHDDQEATLGLAVLDLPEAEELDEDRGEKLAGLLP